MTDVAPDISPITPDTQKKRAIWLDDEHYESLKKRAESKGLNPSSWLRDILDQLDARDAKHCPTCKKPR